MGYVENLNLILDILSEKNCKNLSASCRGEFDWGSVLFLSRYKSLFNDLNKVLVNLDLSFIRLERNWLLALFTSLRTQ